MSEDHSQRIEQIQAELAAILEARLSDLNRTLRETEGTTRRIISAEIEIERHRATRAQLEEQIGLLQQELDSDRNRAEHIRTRHRELAAERDQGRLDLGRLEQEVRETEVEVEVNQEKVRALEEEAEALRNENGALRTKLKTLEENISRMQRLKEELMSSISGLTAQMSGLAGGNPE